MVGDYCYSLYTLFSLRRTMWWVMLLLLLWIKHKGSLTQASLKKNCYATLSVANQFHLCVANVANNPIKLFPAILSDITS